MPPKRFDDEEAIKFAQNMVKKEHEAAGIGENVGTRTAQGSVQDSTRLSNGLQMRTNPTLVSKHGMKVFGFSCFFLATCVYWFSGMTVESRYADGKRICVNCQSQKEAAQKRWFSPPVIPEPPDLPDAFKKTRMLP